MRTNAVLCFGAGGGGDQEGTTRSEIIMRSTELLVHPVLPFLASVFKGNVPQPAARDVTKGRLHLWQVSGSVSV